MIAAAVVLAFAGALTAGCRSVPRDGARPAVRLGGHPSWHSVDGVQAPTALDVVSLRSDGTPVAGAQVAVLAHYVVSVGDYGLVGDALVATGTTDVDGRWRGSARLSRNVNGLKAVFRTDDVCGVSEPIAVGDTERRGATPVVLSAREQPPLWVRGSVRGPDGAAVAGAAVSVESRGPGGTGAVHRTTSAADGSVLCGPIPHHPRIAVICTVSAPGCADWNETVLNGRIAPVPPTPSVIDAEFDLRRAHRHPTK